MRLGGHRTKLEDIAMAVIAIFKYEVKPGRLPDFMAKLAEAEVGPHVPLDRAGAGQRRDPDDRI
jgi:hypothetical protein